MNLHDAIDYLQLALDDPGSIPTHYLNKAQYLGIEALSAIATLRMVRGDNALMRLPGETPDGASP